MESWIVYILLCSDGTYYTGCTNNFENRMIRHNKGYVEYTKMRLPLKNIARFEFFDKYIAYAFEKYLKSGSGRAFMKRHFL